LNSSFLHVSSAHCRELWDGSRSCAADYAANYLMLASGFNVANILNLPQTSPPFWYTEIHDPSPAFLVGGSPSMLAASEYAIQDDWKMILSIQDDWKNDFVHTRRLDKRFHEKPHYFHCLQSPFQQFSYTEIHGPYPALVLGSSPSMLGRQ
jgi:hypothetical protein